MNGSGRMECKSDPGASTAVAAITLNFVPFHLVFSGYSQVLQCKFSPTSEGIHKLQVSLI